MDRNNKNFEKTLNLHKKVLNVYASLEIRTGYFTNKLLTSDNYKESLTKNSNSRYKTYISEMPIELDNKLSNNDLLGNILKDIIIRYSLITGQVTETKLLFSYTNSIENDNKEYKSMNDIIKKEINTINKSGSIIDFVKTYRTTVNIEFAKKMIDSFFELYNTGKIYSEDMPTKCCTKCKNMKVSKNKINVQNYHILFRVEDDPDYILAEYNNLRNTFLIASTIRPWTLIGISNLAIQNNEEYSIVETKSSFGITVHYIIASKYVDDYMANALVFDYKVKKTLSGKMLQKIVCSSPIDYNKKIECITTNIDLSKINTATMTITPAHSYLEYTIFKENNLGQVRNYIDMDGKVNVFAYDYKFRNYKEVELEIIEDLRKSDLLLFIDTDKINMSKCANCGSRLVYRYLSEWYINENNNEDIEKDIMEILKKASIKINIPDKKSKYLKISKNTNKGVNIPIISCAICNKKIINDKVINQYKEKIQKHGVEKLYKMTPEELLDGTIVCECGGIFFFKNENLFNESFEILSSDIATVNTNYDKTYNIFISNIDKFIKSLEINRYYDKFNEEMKKIDKFFIYGNILKNKKILGIPKFYLKEDIKDKEEFIVINIDIDDIINKYGPDILRLWALHKSKSKTILIDENNVKYEERIYTNIRKTLSFIISNILDLDYDENYIDIQSRTDLDKYIYVKINSLHLELIKCYNEFDFYKAYVLIKDFCLETLCEEYFNAIKYNLYILDTNDSIRRSSQSTLYDLFNMLKIYLGPIIPYLFIECCSYLENSKSLLVERENNHKENFSFVQEYEKWDSIFKFKTKINKYITKAQNEKIIGDTLQAHVIVECKKELSDFVNQNINDILRALNVSQLDIEVSDKFNVTVQKSDGQKCERCHNYKNDVGRHVKYRYLCNDCANILENN
ncbi:MAG: class I tRNA ligase family protein [Clostridia bacterium]|nr:class I tRNA ligase family protein [Clostridia bacterium]MDD4386752.1 class I tRNA ligase family protein [Clostridia bacterium]